MGESPVSWVEDGSRVTVLIRDEDGFAVQLRSFALSFCLGRRYRSVHRLRGEQQSVGKIILTGSKLIKYVHSRDCANSARLARVA